MGADINKDKINYFDGVSQEYLWHEMGAKKNKAYLLINYKMQGYSNLNEIVRTYRPSNKRINRKRTAETELKMLKEKLSKVPVLLRDFERKCSNKNRKCQCGKVPDTLHDLESMAELSDCNYALIQAAVPKEEMDIIAGRIVTPWPAIYMYGEGIEKGFIRKYHLGDVILPIGATRIIRHPEIKNALSILFERGNKLQYIEIMMLNKWL